jgi:hypothetical protein
MQTRLHVLQGFLGALSKAKQSVPDIDNESLSKGLEVVDCAWSSSRAFFFAPDTTAAGLAKGVETNVSGRSAQRADVMQGSHVRFLSHVEPSSRWVDIFDRLKLSDYLSCYVRP